MLAPEAVDIKFDRGETYRFAVTAESSEVFALSPFFRVDLPPSGGRVELQPVNGTMNTAYMLQTTSWDDETTLRRLQLPLSALFSYIYYIILYSCTCCFLRLCFSCQLQLLRFPSSGQREGRKNVLSIESHERRTCAR